MVSRRRLKHCRISLDDPTTVVECHRYIFIVCNMSTVVCYYCTVLLACWTTELLLRGAGLSASSRMGYGQTYTKIIENREKTERSSKVSNCSPSSSPLCLPFAVFAALSFRSFLFLRLVSCHYLYSSFGL